MEMVKGMHMETGLLVQDHTITASVVWVSLEVWECFTFKLQKIEQLTRENVVKKPQEVTDQVQSFQLKISFSDIIAQR